MSGWDLARRAVRAVVAATSLVMLTIAGLITLALATGFLVVP